MTLGIQPKDISLLFIGRTAFTALPTFQNKDIDSTYISKLVQDDSGTCGNRFRATAYEIVEQFSTRYALSGLCRRVGIVPASGFMFAAHSTEPGVFRGEFQGHIYGIRLGSAPFSIDKNGGELLLTIKHTVKLKGRLSDYVVASGTARMYDGASGEISRPGHASVLVTPYGGLQFSGVTTIRFNTEVQKAA